MLYAKVNNPKSEYTFDKEKITVLSQDQYYPVSISMGGSITSVFIDGYPDAFNSINLRSSRCDIIDQYAPRYE